MSHVGFKKEKINLYSKRKGVRKEKGVLPEAGKQVHFLGKSDIFFEIKYTSFGDSRLRCETSAALILLDKQWSRCFTYKASDSRVIPCRKVPYGNMCFDDHIRSDNRPDQ